MIDYTESADQQTLREDLRSLVARHLRPEFLGAFTHDPADLATTQAFCRTLAEHDLLTLAWPREFGGQERSVWDQTVVREEMWAFHEPRGPQYMGVNWVGPALMRFGTPEQCRQHLPRIADGSTIWCQGFSEPDAGSDLASLKTSAVPDGDGWLINGQKIWTSYAGMAQWCFLLARTSSGAQKQAGITVFLVDMSLPGIEVRPIPSLVGPHHLNEVFFDSVWVGPDSTLGERDQGWNVALAVLAFERVGIARYARSDRLLNLARRALDSDWARLPAALKSRWAGALVHTRQARLLAYRVIGLQAEGRIDPKDAAAYRMAVTRLDQETSEVLMELIEECSVAPAANLQQLALAIRDHWRYAQASTVASGSIEMQQVLVSRAVLE